MLPDKVFVHRSERNMARLTLDGVDVMGERLAEEVLELIKQKPDLRKISIVAHSVGGLVARYAIGRLYRPSKIDNGENLSANAGEDELKETIGGLVPINFIAVATPHLGSRGNKQVPFLFGVTAFEKLAAGVIHWIFRRTGRHLFLTDNDDGKPPLIKRMVEDHDECYFMSALRSFKRRVAYSNVGYDHIVGWRTSSIRRNVELPKWEDSVNEKYPHIVYEEFCKACDAEQVDILAEDDSLDNIEEELVTGLSRVSWEKVDVSFHSSRLRFAAHSVIQVIDKSFGFDNAVEEAQSAINAAHVEVESVENGVGIVKLMGRYSGFIALYATLASRDVDCCLIPESPFYLEGEFVEQRLKENGHVVIVVAEGAGQEYVARSMHSIDEKDASGNRLLLDVGLWLTQNFKDHFTKVWKMTLNLKYIDPTYMIRAVPSNASDNIYCTLLAQSAVHGAMAGYTGFTVGPVNSRHAYIPISRVTETQNTEVNR